MPAARAVHGNLSFASVRFTDPQNGTPVRSRCIDTKHVVGNIACPPALLTPQVKNFTALKMSLSLLPTYLLLLLLPHQDKVSSVFAGTSPFKEMLAATTTPHDVHFCQTVCQITLTDNRVCLSYISQKAHWYHAYWFYLDNGYKVL